MEVVYCRQCKQMLSLKEVLQVRTTGYTNDRSEENKALLGWGIRRFTTALLDFINPASDFEDDDDGPAPLCRSCSAKLAEGATKAD